MDIYQRYGPALMRKCTRMLGNVPDAEDIVQTLFIDLIKKGNTDVDLPYLYRAATNRCLNHIRDSKRRRQILGNKTAVEKEAAKNHDAVIDRDLLENLVKLLDKKSRQIFVYRYLDNMTQEEIAELTGYSRKTIGKKLHGIKEKLVKLNGQEVLAAEGVES